MKFVGLQVLLKTNGLPRSSSATIESMTCQLGEWLVEDAACVLKLPRGIERQGWRPLGDPKPHHRGGRLAASGRQTRDMSPHQCDGQTATAMAGIDDDLLLLFGARAHPVHAPPCPQASGSALPSVLHRPYNGSGEER